MATHNVPDDLRYTAEHEWIRVAPDGTARIGITAFAQEALGDVVFVTLPEADSEVVAGEACGEVESTKSVSDIYAPLDGSVTAVNRDLNGSPELVNSDPYGQGWMFEMKFTSGADVDQLWDATTYQSSLD